MIKYIFFRHIYYKSNLKKSAKNRQKIGKKLGNNDRQKVGNNDQQKVGKKSGNNDRQKKSELKS